MVIIASLSVAARGFMASGKNQAMLAARDSLITAIRTAQHWATAKASASRSIRLLVSANNIDLQDGGRSLSLGNIHYPIAIGTGFAVQDPTIIEFDKTGRTVARVLVLQGRGLSLAITLEASGYVH